MGEQATQTIVRVVLDTNVFIFGYSEGEGVEVEKQILQRLSNNPRFVLLLSVELEDQILRVAKRVRDKDWAGLLRYLLWSDFNVEFVFLPPVESLQPMHGEAMETIPRKDRLIFLTALLGNADYLVSNNRAFVRSAAEKQNLFKCVTPEEFLRVVLSDADSV
jgi:predicted nucleic acid-binding protein